jgi:hypothetical protein
VGCVGCVGVWEVWEVWEVGSVGVWGGGEGCGRCGVTPYVRHSTDCTCCDFGHLRFLFEIVNNWIILNNFGIFPLYALYIPDSTH